MRRNHAHYLAEMGIDIWVTRPIGATQVPASDQTEPVESGPASVVRALDNGQPDNDARLSHLARIRQSVGAGQDTPKIAVVSEQPVVPSTPAAAPVASGETPQFSIVFAEFDQVLMLFNVHPDQQSLDKRQERIISDLAKALELNDRKVSNLKWPMLDAAHVNQDQNTADQVVANRIRSSIRKSRYLLVFGKLCEGYTEMALNNVAAADSLARMYLPELDYYFTNPSAKRDLWLGSRKLMRTD